jgi:hypothetical protein
LDLYALGLTLHSAVGIAALGSFWVAALARKGGGAHRRAGKIYLVSMVGVMTLAGLMVAGKAVQGDPRVAVFFAFLISLVGTASWLTWFSVRRRRQPEGITGRTYRALATWLVAAGLLAFFGLGLPRRAPLVMFLSLLGLGFGANMWRLALAPRRDGRWWLAHHMNGAMLNFIATHDSFLALGVGSVVPELRQGVPRMTVAVSLTVIAVAVRAWKSRRPLKLSEVADRAA